MQPTYNLTIANSWDTIFVELVPGSVTTSSGRVTTGNGAADQDFKIEVSSFIPVDALSVIHITYRAKLTNNVQSASNVTLQANLRYLTSPNSYAAVINASAATGIIVVSPLVVVVPATSSVPSTKGSEVTIGETMRFTVTITMAEGSTVAPTLLITTPDSLQIVDAYNINLGNAGNCIGGPTITFTNVTAKFVFSVLCNDGDNVVNTRDKVNVGIFTRVLNHTDNVAGAALKCAANITFGQQGEYSVAGSSDLIVVEPALQVVKTAGTPAMGGDFGNNITYTVTVAHASSTSSAYSVKLVDVIPDSLRLISKSVNASSAGTTTVSGNVLKVDIPQLDLGQTFNLTYVVDLDMGTVAGSSIINRANLTWNSLPTPVSPYRNYTTNTSAEVVIGSPVLTAFAITSSSLVETSTVDVTYPPTEQLAVGEAVTFNTVASIPNGPFEYIYLSQQINFKSFLVKNATVTLGSSIRAVSVINVTMADLIAFNITGVYNYPDGVVNASDTISLTVQAVVRNIPSVVNLAKESTTAKLLAPNITSSRTLPLQLVEPLLNMTNALSLEYPSYVQAGDIVNFTVVISHIPTSGSTGYNVKFEDTLGPYYVIVPGSVVASNGTVVKGNNAGETVVVSLPLMSRNTSILNHFNLLCLIFHSTKSNLTNKQALQSSIRLVLLLWQHQTRLFLPIPLW